MTTLDPNSQLTYHADCQSDTWIEKKIMRFTIEEHNNNVDNHSLEANTNDGNYDQANPLML